MSKVSIGFLLFVFSLSASGATDAYFLAKEAFRQGDDAGLASAAQRLRGNILEPYAVYWQGRRALAKAEPDEVASVESRLSGTVLEDDFRSAWAERLGKEGRWDAFDSEYGQITKPSKNLQCYASWGSLSRGGDSPQARRLWLDASARGDGCDQLFLGMNAKGMVSERDLWKRVRVLWVAGKSKAASEFAGSVFSSPGIGRQLAAAYAEPKKYLSNGKRDRSATGRELDLLAVVRLARTDHDGAARLWKSSEGAYSAADRGWVWGQLATEAAKDHDTVALAWYRLAGNELDDDELAWRVREALRAGNYAEVEAAVSAMGDEARAQSAWRYWWAIALKKKGEIAKANALLVPLSSEKDFYGLMAREELGVAMESAPDPYRIEAKDVAEVERNPSIARAFALRDLGETYPAKKEWNYGVRGYDDAQSLAAAQLAANRGWYDRMVASAERVAGPQGMGLRFPTPHRALVAGKAREHGLDESWVYGLVRQESRFESDAKSWVGASGLMQIMPATARWLAGKMGLPGFQVASLTEVDTNVAMGTYYLRHVLDIVDDLPVLATAGYNAGPGRAKRWRDDTQTLEGAVYAESIPFDETRDYVKKVMANAVYYARILDKGAASIKARMGLVRPAD